MSTTLVTGLWDIGRGDLDEGWSRSFQHYLDKFEQLLAVDANMVIYGERDLEEFVFKFRKPENTQFVVRDKEWFKQTLPFDKIQQIRNNPKWYNQVGWLGESTQARLEMYNPLVMSKVFLLHDAKLMDRFNSDYLFWIDAGITNTVHPGYFTHDKVLEKLPKIVSDFLFVCFPYEANEEVHGFDYKQLCRLARTKTNKVARGGFFGGTKKAITRTNSLYYELLRDTLEKGLMGTEESLFTILLYKYPDLFEYAEIESNGLISKFFEDVKNNSVNIKREAIIDLQNKKVSRSKPYTDKSALYVITFNSPRQFETLIESMNKYDPNILNKTTKYLLDNSNDLSTTPRYQELCAQHNFEHIKKDNLGICGGRQFIAEHFEQTGLDYMMFFEDDMFFYPHKGEVCKNGFNRYAEDFYLKVMKIMSKEGFDFLKFCFTEFYGDNSTQWSWYNVPQNVREDYWPDYPKLPEIGLDPNSPTTLFESIRSLEGLCYATGEVYYCNWPQMVSKEGNKKMFLNTKWAHPFEQTYMSHIYQLTRKSEIYPGLLLLTPIEHNRFDHYPAKDRKES